MTRKAITLIEVVVSIGMLMVFLAVVIPMFNVSARAISEAEEKYNGLLQIINQMEMLKKLSNEDLLQLNGSIYCSGEGSISINNFEDGKVLIALSLKWHPQHKELILCLVRSR